MLKNTGPRVESALKFLCMGLGALLLCQFLIVAFRPDPLKNVKVPAIPTFPPTTNAPAVGRMNGTNGMNRTNGTTNTVAGSTNTVAGSTNTVAGSTNGIGLSQSNAVALGRTNGASTNNLSTNAVAKIPSLTPTNSTPARIERIVQSEVFAQIMRPPPMQLMGIAGNDVFLRAPSGQTGMIKEGGELGGVKLLRIGINRILVEEAGQKKELTIFSGLGSESLLPKEQEPSK